MLKSPKFSTFTHNYITQMLKSLKFATFHIQLQYPDAQIRKFCYIHRQLQYPDAQIPKLCYFSHSIKQFHRGRKREITADADWGVELEEIGLREEDLTSVGAELTNLALW